MELPVTNSVVAFGSVVNGGIEPLGDGERNFAEPHGVNDAIPFVALNGSMAFGGENFRQPPGGNGVVGTVLKVSLILAHFFCRDHSQDQVMVIQSCKTEDPFKDT